MKNSRKSIPVVENKTVTKPNLKPKFMKNIVFFACLFIGLQFSNGQVSGPQDCPTPSCFDDGPNGPECGTPMYYDADRDGFGAGILDCFFPSRDDISYWSRRDGDIEPNNPNHFPRAFYIDGDGDGFGTGPVQLIPQGSANPPSGYSVRGDDCDDGDTAYTVAKNWYEDGDSDGFGLTSTQEFGCYPPPTMNNPVDEGGDFDDADQFITNIAPSYFYYDNDSDGYGVDTNPEYRSEPSSSLYVPQNGDCDDNDSELNPETVWYLDADGDGVGVNGPGNKTQCDEPTDAVYALISGDQCPTEFGAEANNGCAPTDETSEPWNSVLTINYNFAEEGIGKSKTYFDALGRSVQSQTLDIETNKVWASDTKYDSQGRVAMQTLSAPINGEGFMLYESDFMLKTDTSPYTSSDFEGNMTNPPAVGEQANTLGWYYSDSNTSEAYQDATDYPFSATEYSTLNPGAALRSYGGNKINGEWPQAYTFSMPASGELVQGVAFGNTDYENIKTSKTVVRDVEGNENVIFTDTDGKTLASARSGGASSRSMALTIGAQGFVDIHVPQGNNLGFTVNDNGNGVTVHDLISEEPVTPSVALPNGFYRVSVNDVGAYDPQNAVTVDYFENYYDYSLNVYDDTDRLVATYQPLGANIAVKPKTEYKYNTTGQLVYTKSPDEGEAWFLYRNDGQIRYSQNSVQKDEGKVSFTDYDEFGRPVKSGVLGAANFSAMDPDYEGDSTFYGTSDSEEEVRTTYDFLELGDRFPGSAMRYLSGNVAMTEKHDIKTWYSYDAYGRVDYMAMDYPELGYPYIKYYYDLETGLVTHVEYQHTIPGATGSTEFMHKYDYNEYNQLIRVSTCEGTYSNPGTYTVQAEYEYYENGSMKRTELAGGVQGIDYVYNLAGQLKGINHPSLQDTKDPGGDDNDLFGMQIDYHNADYKRVTDNIKAATYGTDRRNGLIKGIRWNNKKVANSPEAVYTYNYDRNNWLTDALYGTYDENSTATTDALLESTVIRTNGDPALELKATEAITLKEGFHAQDGTTVSARIVPGGGFEAVGEGDYNVTGLRYDANGNIKRLQRNKDTHNGSNAMDDLNYTYKTDPQNGPNQLLNVGDRHGDVTGADDIGDQAPNSYVYNKIGQLIANTAEQVTYTYYASGQVKEVRKNNVTLVKFFYNERGHRSRKQSFDPQGILTASTHYVSDAEGHVMAIYNEPAGGGVALIEHPVYGGSGRLGVYRPDGSTTYELTDHLGNVRATFTETNYAPVAQGYTDYYPFGMAMPNRNVVGDYRYAFQGQEKDSETGKEAFELRLWDSRIGRWLTTDPYGEFSSPYLGMGNNPISKVDPDGGCVECIFSLGRTLASDSFQNFAFAANTNSLSGLGLGGSLDGVTGIGDALDIGDTREFKAPDPMGVNYSTGIFGTTRTEVWVGSKWIPTEDFSSVKAQKLATNLIGGGSVKLSATFIGRYGNKAWQIARRAASKYKNFQCVECSVNIVTNLKKAGINGEVLELVVKEGPEVIGAKLGDDFIQISTNGVHKAVHVDGLVFDNIFKNGVPFDVWQKSIEVAPSAKATLNVIGF